MWVLYVDIGELNIKDGVQDNGKLFFHVGSNRGGLFKNGEFGHGGK